jgi:hypothetical protein
LRDDDNAAKQPDERRLWNGAVQLVHRWYFCFKIGCGYYDNNTDGIIGIQKEVNDIIIITCVYAMVI